MSGRPGRAASKRATAAGKDYDVDDTPADPGKAETLFVPAFGIDEPDTPQFINSYITSDAKPNDKSAKEKKKRWSKYGVKTDAGGIPLLGGVLELVGGLLGVGEADRRSTPALPATASPRGRAMAATYSRSPR